ncbi:MAG: MGMT family protein [Erysipelotrichaceae bacterium]|nr:MGMT family protein [Erysipelotrichaceae bacterium]
MLKDKVYEYLTRIPKGKVVTYGQIAEDLGNKGYARAIGNILHNNPEPIRCPCFKVVNSKGRLAEHFGDKGGIETQRKRLEADGVEVIDYRVDLNKYQWKK